MPYAPTQLSQTVLLLASSLLYSVKQHIKYGYTARTFIIDLSSIRVLARKTKLVQLQSSLLAHFCQRSIEFSWRIFEGKVHLQSSAPLLFSNTERDYLSPTALFFSYPTATFAHFLHLSCLLGQYLMMNMKPRILLAFLNHKLYVVESFKYKPGIHFGNASHQPEPILF